MNKIYTIVFMLIICCVQLMYIEIRNNDLLSIKSYQKMHNKIVSDVEKLQFKLNSPKDNYSKDFTECDCKCDIFNKDIISGLDAKMSVCKNKFMDKSILAKILYKNACDLFEKFSIKSQVDINITDNYDICIKMLLENENQLFYILRELPYILYQDLSTVEMINLSFLCYNKINFYTENGMIFLSVNLCMVKNEIQESNYCKLSFIQDVFDYIYNVMCVDLKSCESVKKVNKNIMLYDLKNPVYLVRKSDYEVFCQGKLHLKLHQCYNFFNIKHAKVKAIVGNKFLYKDSWNEINEDNINFVTQHFDLYVPMHICI